MENENTKKTAAQEEKGKKESDFNCCEDCCEGMPIDDKMKKSMMGMFKDMKEPTVMFKKFSGCCGPRDAKTT